MTNLDQIFLVLDATPDDRSDVDGEDDDDCTEHGHGLQELLRGKHRGEVDGVGRNHKVAAERCQMGAQALSLLDGSERANLRGN